MTSSIPSANFSDFQRIDYDRANLKRANSGYGGKDIQLTSDTSASLDSNVGFAQTIPMFSYTQATLYGDVNVILSLNIKSDTMAELKSLVPIVMTQNLVSNSAASLESDTTLNKTDTLTSHSAAALESSTDVSRVISLFSETSADLNSIAQLNFISNLHVDTSAMLNSFTSVTSIYSEITNIAVNIPVGSKLVITTDGDFKATLDGKDVTYAFSGEGVFITPNTIALSVDWGAGQKMTGVLTYREYFI